jgi:hypothetical protein
LPDLESNRSLLQALREHGFQGATAIVAREPDEQAALTALGVNEVLVPMTDAVARAVELLTTIMQERRRIA